MHIMEGFLPFEWAVFWSLLCIPFIILGIRGMRKLFSEHPEKKLTLALSGAFIVILSSLKIPSVSGSSSHPSGTGMGVMFSGPLVTAVICTIVLLFQGTFMAHGGYTTLGANVFSMGVAGPLAAYAVYRAMRKRKINANAVVFATVFTADIVTYLVTSLQLALVVPFTGVPAFVDSYVAFFTIFTFTQLPIAVAEGVLMLFFFRYLAEIRPELTRDIGFSAVPENSGSAFDAGKRNSDGRKMIFCFVAALAALIIFVYAAAFFFDIGGADDAGAEMVGILIPGYEKWSGNIIDFGDIGISLAFVVQMVIGLLILLAVMRLIRGRRHRHDGDFSGIDAAAYNSPLSKWPPLAKLFLVASLLVLNIASPSILMPLFTGAVGLVLFLYASSLRPPAVMMRLFVYAQIFIMIGAMIFVFVIPGEMVMQITLFGVHLNATGAGVEFALLIYARATAALLLMFAFAVSTPVPHLAAALKKLRLPDVFVEMMVLIYRYTFLLMESAERMHLAAECRFGYSGYGRSMRTTAKLTAGVFMRSLDTAEKGQITLQCRNYRGEFRSLSEFDRKSKAPAAFCIVLVIATVIFFFTLRTEVLPL